MNEVTITLKRDKECKHSVRFATDDPKAPITNVYVSRECMGTATAHSVTITLKLNIG